VTEAIAVTDVVVALNAVLAVDLLVELAFAVLTCSNHDCSSNVICCGNCRKVVALTIVVVVWSRYDKSSSFIAAVRECIELGDLIVTLLTSDMIQP